MSKRRRGTTQPEYIQLQPYRALVGVPVKDRRFGGVQAFVLGTIKGIMWSVIPVSALVFGLAARDHGWNEVANDIAAHVSLIGVVVAAIGVAWGMFSALRR